MKIKTYDIKTVMANCIPFDYFYKKETNDRNGNPRYRVYIIDPDGPAVYETIFKTYEGLIADHVRMFVEEAIER